VKEKNSLSSRLAALVFIAAISLLFLLFFAYCTSPISVDVGYHAAFFRLVGQGMLHDKLPYRDFFDMKGPYLFLIEYLGQVICYGRGGIFIVQWINLTLVLIIIYRLYEFAGIEKRSQRVLLLLPCLWVLSITLEGGNLTEEFSLIPLLLSLDLAAKYYRGCARGDFSNKPLWGLIYGAGFAFLALIRVTNAAFLCAVVFCISVVLCVKKQFKNLLANAAAFIAGAGLAFLPVSAYFAAKGLMREMLNQVFVFGFTYSSEKTIAEHFREALVRWPYLLVLLIIPVAAFMLVRDWKIRFFSLVASAATFMALLLGNNYLHYNTLLIPLIVLGELIVEAGIKGKSTAVRAWIILVMAVLIFGCMSVDFLKAGHKVYECCFAQTSFKKQALAEEIAASIPEEDRDSVLSYDVYPNWYVFADIFPCIRYCAWQTHYMLLVPEIEVEMADRLHEDPPKWIVMPAKEIWIPDRIKVELDRYEVEQMNDTYKLLHHIE